ncbi:Na+/alanine symporter [Serratia fonticola]|uniref:Na+/alanine symporter n=1 Tax=Serratia fonticola TaxID=47917 RepID=A0A4V6KNH8_SERFO|nr:Na+/alanine symporter [Serratia fonticola]
MALAYLLLALWIIGLNIEHMPAILALIFKSAFGLQEVAAGTLGYGISQAMTQGIQRGLFSNEGGIGVGPPTWQLPLPLIRHTLPRRAMCRCLAHLSIPSSSVAQRRR